MYIELGCTAVGSLLEFYQKGSSAVHVDTHTLASNWLELSSCLELKKKGREQNGGGTPSGPEGETVGDVGAMIRDCARDLRNVCVCFLAVCQAARWTPTWRPKDEDVCVEG